MYYLYNLRCVHAELRMILLMLQVSKTLEYYAKVSLPFTNLAMST